MHRISFTRTNFISNSFSKNYFDPIISIRKSISTAYTSAPMMANEHNALSVNSADINDNEIMNITDQLSTVTIDSTRKTDSQSTFGQGIDSHSAFPMPGKKKPRKPKGTTRADVPHVSPSQFFQSVPASSSQSMPTRSASRQVLQRQVSGSGIPYESRPNIANTKHKKAPNHQDYSTYTPPVTRSRTGLVDNGQPKDDENYVALDFEPGKFEQYSQGQNLNSLDDNDQPQQPAGPSKATLRTAARREHKREQKGEAKHRKKSTSDPQKTLEPSPETPPRGRYGDIKQQLIPCPTPSASYTANIAHGYQTHLVPHPLLVILDLNGVLVHRRKGSKTGHVPRLDLAPFLDYLFTNHHVMIWSSGMPENVTRICKQVLSPAQYNALIAIWARDTLRLPPKAFGQNVQVYKQLTWVWGNAELQAQAREESKLGAPPVGVYKQANTVLIDDSIEKAAAEPWNLLRVDEFMGKDELVMGEKGVLMQVVAYLETVKWVSDASAFMQRHPFEMMKEAGRLQ